MAHRKLITGFISSTGMVALLWLCRVYFSHSTYYGFLLWNLFLAYLPFCISCYLMYNQKRHRISQNYFFETVKWWLLFAAWLLFFPNAPYIITDIIHLSYRHNVPLWYDAVLLFIAALTGLWIGFLSLLQMEGIWKQRFPKINSHLFIITILLLCGFGIYLGRVMRFNSWDVLSNPLGLADVILKRLLMPWQYLRTWCVTLLFAAVLWACYSQVKQLRHIQIY